MSLIGPLNQAHQGGWRPARRDRSARQNFALPDLLQAPVEERPGLALPGSTLTALPSLLVPGDADEQEAPAFHLRIAFYSENQPLQATLPVPGATWDARA
jgi:hypothetical protein